MVHSVYNIKNYFKKINQVIREKQITKLNAQNIDELGFQISCEKEKLIVTVDLNKVNLHD